MEIVIHNFDRLPIKVHGITCNNPIRIFIYIDVQI